MASRTRPARDAAATRGRLLDAATVEYAEHGLAGARVDRIAVAAESNKQLIYAYFGNKRQLFDAVIESRVVNLIESVPFTADDLPGYAIRLRAFNRANPQLMRLVLWHTLECPGELNSLAISVESNTRKLTELQSAQQRGVVSDRLPAAQLLMQILALVHGDVLADDRFAVDDDSLTIAVRRLADPR